MTMNHQQSLEIDIIAFQETHRRPDDQKHRIEEQKEELMEEYEEMSVNESLF